LLIRFDLSDFGRIGVVSVGEIVAV